MSYDDEYYCPNCGAILNDQDGFDPLTGSWTCTECGQHLMDDDIYYGDTFLGIEWHCDCCDALLNRQLGFSDSLDYWDCTACGHKNRISEDDIDDGFSIIKMNQYPNNNEFECPECGAILNDQDDFDEDNNDHIYSSCGAKLHRDDFDDEYETLDINNQTITDLSKYSQPNQNLAQQYNNNGTIYDKDSGDEERFYCPECKTLLYNQPRFNCKLNEYTCTSCKTTLYHYYTDEPYKTMQSRKKAISTSSTNDREKPPSLTYRGTSSSFKPNYKKGYKSSTPNDWVLFLLCLFFGYFGIHKFAEGKVGVGVLYILTFGLFCIGWIVDIYKYFKQAITT